MKLIPMGGQRAGRYKDVAYKVKATAGPQGGYRARFELAGADPVPWFEERFDSPDAGLDMAETRAREAIAAKLGEP